MPLPERDEQFLNENFPGHWELIAAESEQLLILHGYELPPANYTPANVNLLVRIPSGYPSANPDMFFIAQVVTKIDGGAPLNVTETLINGQKWYQWSRHYQAGAWRQGDGIRNYLQAVRTELEKGR